MELGTYNGFEILELLIIDNNQEYTGFVAKKGGVKIESPIGQPKNRRALKQSINELTSRR